MWKWKRRNKPAPELEAIQRLEKITLNHYDIHSQTTNEQIGKLARLQYKNSQDFQVRMEQLTKQLERISARQEEDTAARQHTAELERKLHRMSEGIISWLDDMDGIHARLDGSGQEAWRRLLKQWSDQLVRLLHIADIHELQVLGTSFDPQRCDSIGTVSDKQRQGGDGVKEENDTMKVPYEIVEVVRRGFATGSGELLRKSQVITLEVHNENVKP